MSRGIPGRSHRGWIEHSEDLLDSVAWSRREGDSCTIERLDMFRLRDNTRVSASDDGSGKAMIIFEDNCRATQLLGAPRSHASTCLV